MCDNKRRFMKTAVLLIMASCGCHPACRRFSFYFFQIIEQSCLHRPCGIKKPYACSTCSSSVLVIKNPQNDLINVTGIKRLKEDFFFCSINANSQNGRPSASAARRRARQEKEAREAQLPLKMPACQPSKGTDSKVSSYLIPSCVSLGAISAINTLAVINTVLRRPMAQKG